MLRRLIAITAIFTCLSLAWVILGGTVLLRTHQQDEKLRTAVGQMWGKPQTQKAPVVYWVDRNTETDKAENSRHYLPLGSSQIEVGLRLEPRRKGLLWYATYQVDFSGTYQVANPTGQPRDLVFEFTLPVPEAIYDRFDLRIGTEEQELRLISGCLAVPLHLAPGQREAVHLSYRSQGLDEWWYRFGEGVEQVANFQLRMHTNYTDIDFPRQSLSPTREKRDGDGWDLVWEYGNLLTGIHLGVSMPHPLNPGPWVSQLSFCAPISLFLFFFLLLTLTTVRKVALHPVHYFFVGAAFFAFHLLLAYLADLISLHLAFLVAATVSIALVLSYMHLVVGWRFALVEVGVSQFVFLVLFSYTFFFEGYTGLTITILGILTLLTTMQLTARVDWEQVFQDDQKMAHPV